MRKLRVLLFFIFHFLFFIPCSAQLISTIVDTNGAGGYSGDGGPAVLAEMSGPSGINIDKFGNVYISDGNNVVRKVNSSGIISTFAGDGTFGYRGDGGPATAAELNYPSGVAADDSGNIYIADQENSRIRKVNTLGIISTIAGIDTGVGSFGFSGDGGPATAAELNLPNDIAVDDSGNIYIADEANQRIRKVNTSGIISTFAGNGYYSGMGGAGGFSGDGGPATAAEFNHPISVAVDFSGNVYIADFDNCRIRIVNTLGIIKTFAGDSALGYSGDGGPATAAELSLPTGVTVDDSGNVFIADNSNNRIRKVNTSGIISTFAGNGVGGYYGDGGPATNAELYPTMLATDKFGNIYISDGGNNRIWKVSVVLWVVTDFVTNVNCNGGSNGSVTAIANEGLPPYTYLWSNASIDSTATSLSAGTYTVNVTDSLGTKGSAIITITQPPALSITADSINATNGNCNGSAWAVVNGGTNPYSYLWTGGLTTDSILNQCANYYCCTITDANGCIDSVCVDIDVSTGINEVKGDTDSYRDEKVKVFPNPNDGVFTIALSHAERSEESLPIIQIYNVFGEKILTETLRSAQGDNLIDLTGQPSGVYFYRVIKEDGNLVGEGKVVIEK